VVWGGRDHDCETAALVSRDGSIDWLCLPRFDSGACFAALLGSHENGYWRLAPKGPRTSVERHYRDGSLVLETTFETAQGVVSLVDFMPLRTQEPDVVRLVIGRSGHVEMEMELVARFDYGWIVPWVRRRDGGIVVVAGPDVIRVVGDVPFQNKDFHTTARFTVSSVRWPTFSILDGGWSWRRVRTAGAWRSRSSTTLSPGGRSRTRASGKCGAVRDISRIPR
jgi:hypothetical protein